LTIVQNITPVGPCISEKKTNIWAKTSGLSLPGKLTINLAQCPKWVCPAH